VSFLIPRKRERLLLASLTSTTKNRMESSNGKPPQGKEEGKAAAEGSIGGYESLHRLLESNLSPELFKVSQTHSNKVICQIN
jgi:hypothetical protein